MVPRPNRGLHISPSIERVASPPSSSPPSTYRHLRQPIYPALASPPTSPPGQKSAAPKTLLHAPSSQQDPVYNARQPLGHPAASAVVPESPGRSIATPSRPSVQPVKSFKRHDAIPTSHSSLAVPSAQPQRGTHDAGLSEASAYAREVSAKLAHLNLTPTPSRKNTASAPPAPVVHATLRPLPRPPTAQHPPISPRRTISASSATNKATVHIIASSDQSKRTAQTVLPQGQTPSNRRPARTGGPERPRVTIPMTTGSQQGISQESIKTRSTDVQHDHQRPVGVSLSRPGARNQELTQLSTPATTSTSPRIELRPDPERPPEGITLAFLLVHPKIQTALLSALSINSFLSLSGSSARIRRQFTGEVVGRWVMQQWGVDVAEQRLWPNLTVWEGFLESLLHDPVTYGTYPLRWHGLLRHLCLSHTLVVLFLRSLPAASFPHNALLPFEDEGPLLAPSPSVTSLSSMALARPHPTNAADIYGSNGVPVLPSKGESSLLEIVMPEPLAAQQPKKMANIPTSTSSAIRRRTSIASVTSVTSLSFGRRRSASVASFPGQMDDVAALPTNKPSKKGSLPPVSYPSAKRYSFGRPSDAAYPSRASSESARPGSIYSLQSASSIASRAPPRSATRMSMRERGEAVATGLTSPAVASDHRRSLGSVDSSFGRASPHHLRRPRQSAALQPSSTSAEPAFDRPVPYIPHRAPVLRVFVPLSEKVLRWPSAEGALAAVEELEMCGALKRLRLGDLIVNTGIRQPRTTEHILLFVPFVKHLLVPLQYTYCGTGHLPNYVDAFGLPPSYFYPFLPSPQVIFVNLAPYATRATNSIRLAHDRHDLVISSGARVSTKRYLYVAGFEIKPGDKAVSDWCGMITLEAEGTAEGRADLQRRFGQSKNMPWEIVKEKSMAGNVWLRLIKEKG